MATSQNGYRVQTGAPSGTLKWITGRVQPGDVATVFDYLCTRFNAEVEKIRKDWSWGWAYRAIRGASSGYSNHASGTAIDINAPAHPLGVRGTFSPKQIEACHKILRDLDGIIRWGEDYSGRKDGMHFEIDAPPAKVADVARKIRNGQLPPVGGQPVYKIKAWKVSLPHVRHQFRIGGGVITGTLTPNNGVARVQLALNQELGTTLKVDGLAGPATVQAWKQWESRADVPGEHLARIPDRKSLNELAKGRFFITGIDQ